MKGLRWLVIPEPAEYVDLRTPYVAVAFEHLKRVRRSKRITDRLRCSEPQTPRSRRLANLRRNSKAKTADAFQLLLHELHDVAGAILGVGREEVAAKGRKGDSGRGLLDTTNLSKGFVLLVVGGEISGDAFLLDERL